VVELPLSGELLYKACHNAECHIFLSLFDSHCAECYIFLIFMLNVVVWLVAFSYFYAECYIIFFAEWH
jgi:hypothetical protein